MIKINEAINNVNISMKKMRYYMFTKEVKYIIKDNKFYLEDKEYLLLKKIVVFRRLGLSFEDIDEIKKNIKLYKQLNKIKNLIPDGNKYETIKIIIDEIMNDNVDFNSMNPDKYLEMIDKYMAEGKKFYMFNEDITYEDYKSSKFNFEYMVMITLVSVFFLILCLVSKNDNAFLLYFPFFFIGLLLTLFIFYIPINLKYYKGIMGLLRRNYEEE